MKKYDTEEKRIKAIKKAGNILTFKTPFNWKDDQYSQILVQSLEKNKDAVKIIGFARDTTWYKSMSDLLDAIDWDKMEAWHEED